MRWNREDVAWMAGLFEGEGCCVAPTPKNGLRLNISMTDKDVLVRMKELAGCGCLSGPYQRPGNRKPMWVWQVESRLAYALAIAMWPFLGVRRRQRIAENVGLFLKTPSYSSRRKLTPAQAAEVVEAFQTPRRGLQRALAKRFNVSPPTIAAIRRGSYYRGVA